MTGRSPALGASDKLTFLLSLIPYLMDHDRVTVGEVAGHFGVPEERVREAVRLIAVSGIPGETHQYLHGDLFDIHWDEFEDNDRIVLTHLVAIDDSPRFSAREAAALIAGLQYLSSLPENADRDAVALADGQAHPRRIRHPQPARRAHSARVRRGDDRDPGGRSGRRAGGIRLPERAGRARAPSRRPAAARIR